jgi:hypothetical protein
VVGRECTRLAGRLGRSFEVCADLSKSGAQPTQAGELGADASGESSGCTVFDVSEQVLDANFFCFFCFDGGGNVEEGFLGLCSVLQMVGLDWSHDRKDVIQLTSLIFSTAK